MRRKCANALEVCKCANMQMCKLLNDVLITQRTKATIRTFAHLHICTLTTVR